MNASHRSLVVSALACALAFAAAPARASDEADRLFQLGRRASEMGKYSTACSLFRESYRLEPAVGTLLNLGDCEEQQNHLAAALDYYRTALSRMSVTDDRLGPLRVRIEAVEGRAGRLELRLGEGAPQESMITIDGEPVTPEKLRTPLVLPAGGHLVQVTAVGYRGSRQTVDITAGGKKSLTVWPGPQLDVNELALAVDDRAQEADRESHARTMRLVGWSAAGLGVASLWVGSVTGLFAIDREATRHDNCDAQNACNATGVAAAQSGKTFATVATITLAAGIVGVGAGVYLVATNPPGRGKTGVTSFGAIPLPGGGAVSVRHRF